MTTPPAILSSRPRPRSVPACVTLRRTLPKPRPAPLAESETCSRTLACANSMGLHARPAALLLKTVSSFECEVTAQHHGHQVNVRSILGLLSLAVGPGSQVTFTACGPDAAAAVAAIARLFESRFKEGCGSRSGAQPPTEVATTA